MGVVETVGIHDVRPDFEFQAFRLPQNERVIGRNRKVLVIFRHYIPDHVFEGGKRTHGLFKQFQRRLSLFQGRLVGE